MELAIVTARGAEVISRLQKIKSDLQRNMQVGAGKKGEKGGKGSNPGGCATVVVWAIAIVVGVISIVDGVVGLFGQWA